jgi:hypothetical protein
MAVLDALLVVTEAICVLVLGLALGTALAGALFRRKPAAAFHVEHSNAPGCPNGAQRGPATPRSDFRAAIGPTLRRPRTPEGRTLPCTCTFERTCPAHQHYVLPWPVVEGRWAAASREVLDALPGMLPCPHREIRYVAHLNEVRCIACGASARFDDVHRHEAER